VTESITPGVGSLIFTGFAPTVTESITPGVGSLIFTGFAPTVTESNPDTINVFTGSLIFTGFVPTVTTSGGDEGSGGGTKKISEFPIDQMSIDIQRQNDELFFEVIKIFLQCRRKV
jgi:hypothetical protein